MENDFGDVQPAKPYKSKQLLPVGTRGIIYSFIDLMTLINLIQRISVKDRNLLLTEILD